MSSTTPAPQALIHIRSWLDDGLDDRFAAWCDDHHPELIALPRFQQGRRFVKVRSLDAEASDYLTVYDLDGLDALDAPEYRDRPAGGLPDFLQGRLRATHVDLTVAARWIRSGAAPVESRPFVAHLHRDAGHGAPPAELERVAEELGRIPEVTAATAYRHPDGQQVILVELDDGDIDLTTLPALDGPGGAGWTLFRRQFLGRPDRSATTAS